MSPCDYVNLLLEGGYEDEETRLKEPKTTSVCLVPDQDKSFGLNSW